jgi:predicted nucleic acid-binding protein
MEWVRKLHGTTVGLDTAPLIYFIERHPKYLPFVYPFFESVQRGEIRVVTSTLTLTEVLVHPYKRSDRQLAEQYSALLLSARNVSTLSVTPEIAQEAARLRAMFGFKTPDSIQLATARVARATAFLSNDSALRPIPGVELILLDQLSAHP